MSAARQTANCLEQAGKRIIAREWEATYRLDEHIAEARERMGPKRWAELEADWHGPAAMKGEG